MLVGALGADGGDVTLGEQAAQLVLGGNGEDGNAGALHGGVDGAGAKESGIGELDLLARRIEVVVAGDAVDGGGSPVTMERLLGVVRIGVGRLGSTQPTIWTPSS